MAFAELDLQKIEIATRFKKTIEIANRCKRMDKRGLGVYEEDGVGNVLGGCACVVLVVREDGWWQCGESGASLVCEAAARLGWPLEVFGCDQDCTCGAKDGSECCGCGDGWVDRESP